MKNKILIVRKMSSFEYYYNGKHKSKELLDSHEEQKENVQKILKILDNNNFIYDIITRKDLSENRVNQYDFIFSLGGDGTVIATAAFNKDKPQLNIKTDDRSVGALCSQNTDQALEDFFNGSYQIEEWTRQDVYLDSRLVGIALNETAIGEEGMRFTKMAKYNINGQDNENSGLVIATGTGSTGWPNAFSPHPRTAKDFIYAASWPRKGEGSGKGDNFKIKYKGHNGTFAIDTIEYDLPRDSILEIKVSKSPLNVMVSKE